MNNQVTKLDELELPAVRHPLNALDILEGAVKGGITAENVQVVKEILALRRDEVNEIAKQKFAQAFFKMKKNMPIIHADKEAVNDLGKRVYVYCSEEEITKKLEPVLMEHGFCMLFGQKIEGDLVTIEVTLIHEGGHQEKRPYTVRTGSTNRMKDATAADTGATTSAWRHCMIKLFGLKSRINLQHDPRVHGEEITPSEASKLQHRVKMLNGDEVAFLKYCGVQNIANPPALDDYKRIKKSGHERGDQFLSTKEKAGK